VFQVNYYRDQVGSSRYEEYLNAVERGQKKDAAKIRTFVQRLAEIGSFGMSRMEWAKKLNDVWELRPKSHRITYFWDSVDNTYVLLHGFRKTRQKTPQSEIEKAEALRERYLVRRP